MAKKATAKKAAPKKCNCVTEINEALKPHNARLASGMQLNFKTGEASVTAPHIELVKLDSKKRGRLPAMFCTYCPFCGIKKNER